MSSPSLITPIILSVLSCPVWSQVRPPNLSPDNLPDTAFTCEDKVTGGYYADVEADCQLFHVCVQVSEYEFQDFHFLCPNDTVFDQQHLVCTNWFEVDCHAQLALVPLQFFTNDFGIKRGGSSGNTLEDEDVHQSQQQDQNFLGFNQSPQKSRLRNTGRGQLEVGRRRPGAGHRRQPQAGAERQLDVPPTHQDAEEEVLQSGTPEEKISLLASITGSTPIPLGFTTTIRPPRAIESSGGFLSGRNLVRNHQELHPNEDNDEDEEVVQNKFSSGSVRKFNPDRRKPKVKANIRAKLAHSGKKKFFQKFEKPLKKSGRKVNLDHSRKNKIEFVEPQTESAADTSDHHTETEFKFTGPELRPDGRAPRVKSDIYAEHPNRHELTTTTTSTTPEPFIEPFFASPSSPQPFIFRGTPDPYGDGLLGSASTTEKPFFPTIKSLSDTPQTDALQSSVQDQEDSAHKPASDRFVSRPSPKRGRHRVVLESDQVSSLSGDDNQDTRTGNVGKHQKSLKQRLRKNKINPFSNSINNIDDEHDEGCNNPFDCPPRFKVAAGRRPRVKANLRARKRNFWHKNSVGSGDSSDIGHGFRRGRKIRRGRKQITDVIGNADIESDIQEDQTDDTVNETTEQFVPTTRTTTEREPTTTQAVKEEENEIFDDFFDHENDFFAASSTISPVVFKGSPGPGFFSSPRPFYDNEGNQVSFTSPNPFGGPNNGRPSFNNIGAHIDLGPPKPQSFLSPDQLLFISSTVSNKIFIGSEDETTTTPTPVTTTTATAEETHTQSAAEVTPKRSFPSFPIRGGSSDNLLKPRLDFSRKTKAAFKFGRQQQETDNAEEREEIVTEQSDITTTEQSTTTSPPQTSSKRFFVDLTGGSKPRVKSNLLFNKRKFSDKKERFRLKLANFKATSTTPADTTSDLTTTTTTATSDQQEVQLPTEKAVGKFKKFRKNPLTFFRKVPDVSFTNTLLKFKARSKASSKPVIPDTTTIDAVDNEATTVAENLLSVESELEDDNNEQVNIGGKWPSVRKANKAPANGNIRVEFKKKVEDDSISGLRGKFLINPDGRKPRVKSNIRAKFAHRGQHFASPEPETEDSREQETFDGASSQLDLTPFSQDIESGDKDITEKREVDIAEAPNTVAEPVDSKPALQFSHELPLFPLQPVILNPRQSHRQPSEKPPLPASILKHINHITDIRSLPPLPPLLPGKFKKVHQKLQKKKKNEEPISPESKTSNSLLEKLMEHEHSQTTLSPTTTEAEPSTESIKLESSVPSVGGINKLSAFRALQKQVEKSEQVEVSSHNHDAHENLV